MKLNLDAHGASSEDYRPTSFCPLPYDDGTIEAVRVGEVLGWGYFPEYSAAEAIMEWVRALKPGGTLRIAISDTAMQNEGLLRKLMSDAGLSLLRLRQSEIDACTGPIPDEMEGTKPFMSEIKVSAAMSVPRLGFMDNFGCCIDALLPLGIRLRRQGGAFWGQALENCLEQILDQDKPDAILTLDYDSVFTIQNVAHLMQLMICHPEADAIAAVQSSRHLPTALFTKRDGDGKPLAAVSTEWMQGDLMPISSAHFGLTLIRADKLAALPKPWFVPVASPDGNWHHEGGKIDEDINFWVKWETAGNTLFLANHVTIGHAELMVRWPGDDLQAFYQPIREFNDGGPPDGIWR